MTDYYKDKQKLTDEQIAELAPDWATHYCIYSDYGLSFQDNANYQDYCLMAGSLGVKINHKGISEKAKPIPRKPFDISEYEFSDERIGFSQDEKGLLVEVEGDFYEIAYINKNDAIALAKHFKLTAGDLK